MIGERESGLGECIGKSEKRINVAGSERVESKVVLLRMSGEMKKGFIRRLSIVDLLKS